MTCPRCGLENRPEAAYCRECGASIPRNLACPTCNATVAPGQLFCDRCGSRMLSREEAPEPPSTERPTSFVLGRYRVLGLLGEGSHKRVYLVHDELLDRRVAFVLIRHEAFSASMAERSRREARAMARLPIHPNLVTVHDAGEDAGLPYIVQEYVDGGTVADLLERRGSSQPLEIGEAMSISVDISAALEHAHAHDILHRDVKPANIWLSSAGTAKLGDFGLVAVTGPSSSQTMPKLTHEGFVAGTPVYMAPEQALGDPVDARTDLYAFGVTLYEMVTGRPPFWGDSPVAIVAQHVHTPPVAPDWHNADLPKPLCKVILQLLEKNPRDRPQSASAVHAVLVEMGQTGRTWHPVEGREANPLDALAEGVFVGREPELQALYRDVDRLSVGGGGIVLIAGPAGIGKTSLAEQMTTYAQLRNATVLWGRCYSGSGAPPYWPWAQAIRAYAADHQPSELSAALGQSAGVIADLVPDIRQRLPDVPESPVLTGEQARFRLFDGVSTFFVNASRSQSLVVVLDDLQNADAGSLLLLEFLAQEVTNRPLLVVGIYRDDELEDDHPLSRTAAELARLRSPAQRLSLEGLTPAQTNQYISLTTGLDADDQLVSAVYAKSEGNPFYVVEIVRLLAQRTRPAPRASAEAEVTIPNEVRDLVRRRLERLPSTSRDLLAIAAVIGRSFQVRLLELVAGLSAEEILTRLDDAIAAHVIVELAPGELHFSQAVICETLRDGLPMARRLQLHRHIALALEQVFRGKLEPHLAEIAYHLFQAGPAADLEQAVVYGVAAAEHATERLAYEEAERLYERTLAALDTTDADDPRRCDLLLALGEVRAHGAAQSRASESFKEAAALARRMGSPERLARAALGLAGPRPTFGIVDAEHVTMLEEALAALRDRNDALRAQLLSRLAFELYHGSEHERRELLIRDALETARRTGDAFTTAYVLGAQYALCWGPGTMAERLEIADEVVGLARRTGDRELECDAHSRRAVVLLEMGDIDATVSSVDTHRRLAQELQNPLALWRSFVWEGALLLLAGRLEEAEVAAERALAYGQRFRLADAEGAFAMQGDWTKIELGHHEDVLQVLRSAGQHLPMSGFADGGVAYFSAELGREEAAAEAFATAMAGRFADSSHDSHVLPAMIGLAETCAFLADVPRAVEIYKFLLPYSGQNVVGGDGWFCFGPADRALGMLTTTLGDWEAAERHFEAAMDLNRRTRAPTWQVRTQLAYARMLLRRGDSGDVDRARDLLAVALDGARELGMSIVAARIDAQLAAAPPSAVPGPTPDHTAV
jgi:eukaryotic-like serine/threonine-protein kinase